jgi:hypothetical protein
LAIFLKIYRCYLFYLKKYSKVIKKFKNNTNYCFFISKLTFSSLKLSIIKDGIFFWFLDFFSFW